MLNNKVILITGGSGSLGNHLTQRIFSDYNPKKIIILSRDEHKHIVMKEKFIKYYNEDRLRFFIGDVRDKDRLKMAFEGVDFIIHAAALKVVPSLEYNPAEAIKTNIQGGMNVIDAAIECNVKKVIFVSTDKACYPINLYGATKMCSEKLFTASNAYCGGKDIVLALVRYGNVAGSNGSVIPFFKKLKDVLPVTHKDMTRFFITLDQAVELIYKAILFAKGGEIFVPKIPSFKITDLVEALGREYKEVGVRAGEKLHEYMVTYEESLSTYEYDWGYIIYPFGHEWFDKKNILEGGFKSISVFAYSSDNNIFLTVEELKKLI